MNPGDTFKPSSKVVYTALGEGEAVLLHLDTKDYFSLNETGIIIWESLGQNKTVKEITTLLTSEYEISAADAEAHVRHFLEELRKDELIVLV